MNGKNKGKCGLASWSDLEIIDGIYDPDYDFQCISTIV